MRGRAVEERPRGSGSKHKDTMERMHKNGRARVPGSKRTVGTRSNSTSDLSANLRKDGRALGQLGVSSATWTSHIALGGRPPA